MTFSFKNLFLPGFAMFVLSGCSSEPAPPPPVNMENFKEVQEKQEEVHRKEYGGEATKKR
ncbi:MAG: hypothetical protein ACKO5E_07230 [bacterium]